jgi:hypothetical protein
MARATFRGLRTFITRVSVASNFNRTFPVALNAELETDVPSLWDVGQWDVSLWDDSDDSEARVTYTTNWKSVTGAGAIQAMQWQITCGGQRKPDAELVTIDLLYQVGGVVV